MLWINFLHLYQPANLESEKIREATERSYARIIRALEENRNFKLTLNISGCLLLRWEEMGYLDLIKRVAKLVKQGKVELVGTAAYHPLLPLIPEAEAIQQIKEHEQILKKFFGADFKPRGFFCPEMAYGVRIGKIIKSLGYEWLILDEISRQGKLANAKKIQENKEGYFIDSKTGLKVVFRDRSLSQTFVPDTLKNIYAKSAETFISATDAEIYGLRHIDHTAEFEKLLRRPDLKTLTISEFIKQAKKIKKISLIDSNWESTEAELKGGIRYALWQDPKNIIQKKLWELANFSYSTTQQFKNDSNIAGMRWHLIRGLASCSFWWASSRDFELFGAPAWNPDEIEKGINELVRVIRSIDDKRATPAKIKAEKMVADLRKLIWVKHWERK